MTGTPPAFIITFIRCSLEGIYVGACLLYTSRCVEETDIIQKNNKSRYKQVNNSAFYIRYTIYIVMAFLLNVLGIYIESYVVPMFIVIFSSAFL